ncbi:RNA polymerase sigma factor [Pedobacter duraquae]|uniref:DNA-directed RNA polymerase specialized sigma24 family protein n=1 Tax=Pedobacter duraquae TaxID=425511 RepID=A0A4R6IQ38_9SPHI|nr:sigma factor-like helix-turn-helix DNA-binding protein [Pedobacter duraquae]TDO24429.1 DNA-directed RNA polymerase specialized sigma24 family protein [Pedobacter duraquae]
MLKTEQHTLIQTKQERLRGIYTRHSSKLFGYIYEVVKDHKIAEDYLVKIFQDIAMQPDDRNLEAAENWMFLQRFAKNRLAVFVSSIQTCDPIDQASLKQFSGNRYLEILNEEQKRIFCDVYYHGRTIHEIAVELNQSEDLTRKILKESFAIMRRSGGN